jgi:hypothetical protein
MILTQPAFKSWLSGLAAVPLLAMLLLLVALSALLTSMSAGPELDPDLNSGSGDTSGPSDTAR